MIDGPFALAFTAGMVASVNPCGFAMLPAYLSYFLGLGSESPSMRTTPGALQRALVVSAVLLAGFLTVFGGFGVLVRAAGVSSSDILRHARWPATVIGIALVILGLAMAAGWHLPFALPRMDKGGGDRTVWSMFVFGVSYAFTSLSCSSGPFISAVVNSFSREGFLSGVLVFFCYALGMGLVVGALTVSMSLAEQGLLRGLRAAMRYVERVAGVLVALSGLYLVYYWGFDGRTRSDAVERVQNEVQGWIAGRSAWSMALVLGTVVAAAGAVVVVQRHRPGPRAPR